MRTHPTNQSLRIPGELVTLPLPQGKKFLDGFWRHAQPRNRTLIVFVHGMGSNFYHSRLKKELMLQGPDADFDTLLFNNRGAESGTIHERFLDCLADLDAALAFGRSMGYRQFVLAGHSTGCQKSTYYQAVRRRTDVRAVVLLAPADDHALCRRDLGRSFPRKVQQARSLVAAGRGRELITGLYEPFSARRFLSVADPLQLEASIFNYDGDLRHFQRLRCPVLAVFGSREEFAVRPVAEMLERLQQRSRSSRFTALQIPNADHGFHGHESKTASALLRWLQPLRTSTNERALWL